MVRISQYLTVMVLVLAAVSVALGAVFIYQGIEKETWMREAMRVEKITLGLPENTVEAGEVIDSPEEAQAIADMIREHRRAIAPSYQELLGEDRFDPTNLKQLTYAQALNMENYLYLAVLGFGVTTVVIAVGAFMVIVGISLGAIGVTLLKLTGRISQRRFS